MEILENIVQDGSDIIGSWVQDSEGRVTANLHYTQGGGSQATMALLTAEHLFVEPSQVEDHMERLIRGKHEKMRAFVRQAPGSIRDNINKF